MSKNNASSPTVTLYGNLGADPKLHVIPAKVETFSAYDSATDGVVDKQRTVE